MMLNNLSVVRTSCIVVFTVALAIAMPSSARAASDDPFTAKLTSFTTSTTQAGAHPDLTFKMEKTRNHCFPLDDPYQPPWPICLPENIYEEQNIKKMAVSFPPGLMVDVNAAPYCDVQQDWYPGRVADRLNWDCFNPDARPVGSVQLSLMECYDPTWQGCSNWPNYSGVIYNDSARPGELVHMVILWPEYLPGHPWFDGPQVDSDWSKTDISIKVRDDGNGMDLVVGPIPDWIPELLDPFGGGADDIVDNTLLGQIYKLEMTLNGETGSDIGHSFLTNPTSCGEGFFDVMFRGYKNNSFFTNGYYGGGVTLGSGDGKIATPWPTPYQMTDCDSVPYAPTFTTTANTDDVPGAAPGLTTTIAQDSDEATTEKVRVELPRGMGMNINSLTRPCPAADLARSRCPQVSKIGTVEAESRLLPKREILGDDVAPEDEVLKGDVFLTGREGNEVTISAFLEGAFSVRLDAKAAVEANGTVVITLEDLPSFPYNKVTIDLFGGGRGLLSSSRACGRHTTTATFTSHSGKVHTVETTSPAGGCGNSSNVGPRQ